MGSGKTYIGQRLAQVLGFDFLDLDAYLIEKERLTIAQIFEQQGEDYFRQKESFYLKSLAERQNTVISTGGGAPCFFDNMAWIQANGKSIYLKPSETLLFQRLTKEAEHRPLLHSLSPAELMLFIQHKTAEREPFYKKANFIIKFDENNQDKVLGMINGIMDFKI
jgi:shikimate kinase